MTWFEELTGCAEESPAQVRQNLAVDGPRLRSHKNGRAWRYGALKTPTLAELRDRVRDVSREPKPLTVREVVADVQALHADEGHANALFQVASQFNLLEMVSPNVTPEQGVAGTGVCGCRRRRYHLQKLLCRGGWTHRAVCRPSDRLPRGRRRLTRKHRRAVMADGQRVCTAVC